MNNEYQVIPQDDKIFIEEQAPIELGAEVEAEIHEDDPRAAIYAKRDEQIRAQAGEEKVEAEVKEHKPEPEPDEVTVIVNGKERKVHKSKIDDAGGVAAYQKNAAASEMLNQASAELRQVKEQERRLAEREAQLQQRELEIQSQQRGTDLPATADDIKVLAGKYHEAMTQHLIGEGDIETANELLIRLQAAQKATVNPDEIANKAVYMARRELEAESNAAKKARFDAECAEGEMRFKEQFPDLAEDPLLFKIVNDRTGEIYQANPNKNPVAIIEEAAKEIRNLFSKRNTATSTDSKLAAKRSQDTVKGGSVRMANRPAPAPQTKSNYVQELRIARGLE